MVPSAWEERDVRARLTAALDDGHPDVEIGACAALAVIEPGSAAACSVPRPIRILFDLEVTP